MPGIRRSVDLICPVCTNGGCQARGASCARPGTCWCNCEGERDSRIPDLNPKHPLPSFMAGRQVGDE